MGAGKKRDLEPGLRQRHLRSLVVTLQPAGAFLQSFSLGRLRAGAVTLGCAIGGGRIKHDKREGDRATPAGPFRLLFGFYRADRVARNETLLPMRPLSRRDLWCDDPESARYNRLVAAPFRPSHEKLWRDDHLYDIVIALDYNLYPRRKGRGSAIFLHCARLDFLPTEGCIALKRDDLRRLLPRLSQKTILIIR